MKTIIKNAFLIGAVTLAVASCGENSWNDTYLPGFEGDKGFTDVQTLEYTLTDADYKRIADNKANSAIAKAAGLSKELTAVGTLHYLTQQISADVYIPNLLNDSTFQYFTLTDGSAINVTYNVAENLPAEMIGMNAASTYTVSKADYQKAYDSETDYAESFSPLAPASSNVPKLLAANFPNATAGSYVVVNYNNSDSEPVFQKVPFEETDVIKPTLKKGDEINARGIVTGICAQGFVLTDKGGSILVYFGNSYDLKAYSIGDQVTVKGTIDSYNKGLQITGSSATVKKADVVEVTYPTPKVYTGAEMDQAILRSADELGVYCEITGKVTIANEGKNYNVAVDGAQTAEGSLYQLTDDQKKLFKDGDTYKICGYFLSVTSTGKPKKPKYFNVLVTDAKPVTKATRSAMTRAANIPSKGVNALYMYDGSNWKVASDAVVLQPSDYAMMGISGGYLTADQAASFIPKFMEVNYPYAAKDAKKYVVYAVKDGFMTEEYTFNGSVWENSISNEGVVTLTRQFVRRDGKWFMDPSITLTLPSGRNQATSTWFFQTCVDWIRDNVQNGAAYITSYGNNEYYCGTSAFEGNIDLRPNKAVGQYAAGYEGMSDDEIVALMKKRFETEVCPGALSVLYPNLEPAPGVEPTVTINFSVYTGSKASYTIIYKVVGKAKFEFVSCTWNQ